MADLLKINKEQIRESMKRFMWSLNFLAEPKAFVLESFDERREYISKLKETYSLYLITRDGIANDPSHGYNLNEWGSPDYDCGHLVISALEHAGINVRNSDGQYLAGDTTTMISTLLKPEYGFVPVTDYNLSTGEGLQPSDILMRERHARMFIGNYGDRSCYVDASHNELRDENGDFCYSKGADGDQVQERPEYYNSSSDPRYNREEIGIRDISRANFGYVYRYVGV